MSPMIINGASATRGVAGAVLSLFLCVSALAAQASPLVCSLTFAIDCDETLGCADFQPELAAPTFLHIDAARSAVTILAPDERRGEVTEIMSAHDLENGEVLTGTQAARGWSMTIADTDGAMTLTISDKHVGLVVFGRCIAGDLLSP
jgi:hypothetical protein